jgi:hypothetical protein
MTSHRKPYKRQSSLPHDRQPKIHQKNILTAHQTATNNPNQDNTLLAIQDTTSVNYDTHKKMIGLGYNCEKSLDINIHSCLLITPSSIPIELIDQTQLPQKQTATHAPPQKKQTQHPKQRKLSMTKNHANHPNQHPKKHPTNPIANQEGDNYQGYNLTLSSNQSFVIRAKHDHLTPQSTHICEEVVRSKPKGQINLLVSQNPKTQTKEREATLTLRYITTQIQCPQNRSEAELAPALTVNLVNVAEEEAPDGVEPLE